MYGLACGSRLEAISVWIGLRILTGRYRCMDWPVDIDLRCSVYLLACGS